MDKKNFSFSPRGREGGDGHLPWECETQRLVWSGEVWPVALRASEPKSAQLRLGSPRPGDQACRPERRSAAVFENRSSFLGVLVIGRPNSFGGRRREG